MNVYFTLFNRKNSLQKLKRCIKIHNLSNNIKRSLCFSFIDNIPRHGILFKSSRASYGILYFERWRHADTGCCWMKEK